MQSDVWSGRKIQMIIDNGGTKLVVMDPKVKYNGEEPRGWEVI
jgi:hypothetical protein